MTDYILAGISVGVFSMFALGPFFLAVNYILTALARISGSF